MSSGIRPYNVLNMTEDSIIIDGQPFESGKAVTGLLLSEETAERYYKTGLHLLDPNSGLDFSGPAGPSPWTLPSLWQSEQFYTNVFPASAVVFSGKTYVCVVAHVSSEAFDPTKFQLIADRGEQGIQGFQGIQGIQGIDGKTPWKPAEPWGIGILYTDVAPASVVTYLGSTYVCISEHTSGLNFDGSKFRLLVAKGDQGDVGPTGPAPWKPISVWATNTAYTSAIPASIVYYSGSAYYCITSHTSTSSFDATKWTLIVSRGNSILNGTTAPSNSVGIDGDFYIFNRSSTNQGRVMYGPKSSGIWPSTFWVIEVYSYTDVPGLTTELNKKANTTDIYSKAEVNAKAQHEALLAIAIS